MTIEIKYFKITDPKTNKVTKEVGTVITRTVKDYKAKTIAGKLEVLKDEAEERVTTSIPEGDDVVEISREEFDAIDVSGESLSTQLRLERVVARLERYAERDRVRKGGSIGAGKAAERLLRRTTVSRKLEKA